MSIKDKITKVYRECAFSRNDRTDHVHYFTAKDFPNLRVTPYDFKSKKGHTLRGYIYSTGEPSRTNIVIFDHGLGGGHTAYMKEIVTLANAGYTVFSYDHTGCMSSEGENTGGFSQSLSDLDDCLTTLKADPVYKDAEFSVIGHSWGGFAALNIAAYHPDVKKIVAMSGYISVWRMMEQMAGPLTKLLGSHLYEMEKESNPGFAEACAIKSLKDTDAKVLVIHSKDDHLTSFRYHFGTLKRAMKNKENIRFIALSGRRHNPSYTRDAVMYKADYFNTQSKLGKKGLLSTPENKQALIDNYDWHRMTAQDDSVWREIFDTLSA